MLFQGFFYKFICAEINQLLETVLNCICPKPVISIFDLFCVRSASFLHSVPFFNYCQFYFRNELFIQFLFVYMATYFQNSTYFIGLNTGPRFISNTGF